MASKLNGHNGTSNGHNGGLMLNPDATEEEILGLGDYSSRLERVLLALMRQQEALQKAVQTEKCEREKKEKELKDQLDNSGKHFEDMLKREREDREKMNEKLDIMMADIFRLKHDHILHYNLLKLLLPPCRLGRLSAC